MANRERGEVSLTVGETSYTLKQSFNGMLEAEEASESIFGTRLSWDDIGAKVGEGDLRSLRLYLWGLLRKSHPEIALEHVGNLVDDAGGVAAFGATFEKAAAAAAPDPADLKALGVGKNGRPLKARGVGIGEKHTSPHAASA